MAARAPLGGQDGVAADVEGEPQQHLQLHGAGGFLQAVVVLGEEESLQLLGGNLIESHSSFSLSSAAARKTIRTRSPGWKPASVSCWRKLAPSSPWIDSRPGMRLLRLISMTISPRSIR